MCNTRNTEHFSWLRLITRDVRRSRPKSLIFPTDPERFSLLIAENM